MNYDVPCECGRSVSVSGADAGTQRSCECGRTVEVPSLRQLRLMAGQAATDTPELVLTGMLNSGSLPEGDCCAVCGTPTDRSVLVRLDCERSRKETGGLMSRLSTILSVLTIGGMATRMFESESERDETGIGQDVWFDVPLMVCADCVKGLRGRRLIRALTTEYVYANLLQKYPRTRAEIVPAGATS